VSQICDNPPLMRDQRAQNRVDQTSACLRVDNIPAFARPFYIAIAWMIGAILFAYYAVCRVTSRISIEGPGNHDLSRHSIFCIWHESWWTYPVVFLRYRTAHAMISHPAVYMKPLHCVFRLMGLKGLFLGSSGNEGRQAVYQVAKLVRKGWSTTISPDGPKGPARVLKKGVLHIALQSGVPIVPLSIRASRFIRVPSWDCKKHPLPFARIRVVVHEAIHVERYNLEKTAALIATALE
jgi:lysophospholipid acyltransferase (LPLAT)-like uncharacterized protein